MNKKRGIIVSLSGPDGVGKSTTLNSLKESLTGYEIIIRNWRPGLLKSLHSLVGKKPAVIHTDAGLIIPRRKAGRYQFIRYLYYWIDFVLGYFFKDRQELKNSKIICYDRSYLDVFVDPVRFGLKDSKLSRFLFKRVPKHDLSILLYDLPAKIYKRKPELSLDVIQNQINAYFNLVKGHLINTVIEIDAPPAMIANRLKDLIAFLAGAKNFNQREEKLNQIQWLNLILFRGNHCRFSQNRSSDKSSLFCDQYMWLDLKDGRGYLLPVAPAKFFKQSLSIYTPQNTKSKFFKGILSGLSRCKIERFLLPRIFIDGASICDENTQLTDNFLYFLKREFGDNLLFSISIGAPGPAQKPVLSVISRDKQTIIGYIKVGWNDKSIENIQNEEKALKKLSNLEFRHFTVPQVIKSGSWNQLYYCYQSTLPNLKPYNHKDWSNHLEKVLKELKNIEFKMTRLQDTAFWKHLNESVSRVKNLFYSNLILKSLEKIEQKVDDQLFPMAVSHGDLTPWNIKQAGDKLFIFDWEFNHWEAPFGWDVIRYFLHHYRFVEKYPPGQLCALFFEPGKVNGFIKELFDGYNLNLQYLEISLLNYLVHELMLYLIDDQNNIDSIMFFQQMLNLMIYRYEVQA